MPDKQKKTVSATQTSALFGASPYETRFTLWAEFTGVLTDEVKENERMSWGKRLQRPILEWVAEEYGLELMPNMGDVYFRDKGHPVGCTADGLVFSPDRGLGFVEVKCVDYFAHRDKWREKTAPRHIELQHQAQLSVEVPYPTDDEHIVWPDGVTEDERNELVEFLGRFHGQRAKWGMIVCLVGGNDAHVIERLPSKRIIKEIRQEAKAFMLQVKEKDKPAISGDEMEFAALNKLYADIQDVKPLTEEDLKDVEAVRTFCAEFIYWNAQRRGSEKSEKSAKARIMEVMGKHAWMRIPSFSVKISRSVIEAAIVTLPEEMKMHVLELAANTGTDCDKEIALIVTRWSQQIRKESVRASFNCEEIENEVYIAPEPINITAAG